MAIIPTGAIFHKLVFGSVDSSTYGIYITGQAVYNAPTRAVEMVSVPGRNGQIALDQGRWENIDVTYPAGCFADSENDFRDAISAFRNAVVSQLGYQRLTDTYNPNEYRMGVYMDGLEVKPSMLRAGQFDITFNCKPQRWLTSGEAAVTIANSGDTITNPTQYASSPLLAVKGYGTIAFNGYEVEIDNAQMGEVVIRQALTNSESRGAIPDSVIQSINIGDTIKYSGSYIEYYITNKSTAPSAINSISIVSVSGDLGSSVTKQGNIVYISVPPATMTFGTYEKLSDMITVDITFTGGATDRLVFEVSYNYLEVADKPHIRLYANDYSSTHGYEWGFVYSSRTIWSAITADSTVPVLSNLTYIDCDLGECYKIESDVPISLNAYIDLGSDLPELASGSNTITFDNTVTELKIQPRWWKL